MKLIFYAILLFSTFSFAQSRTGGDEILYNEGTSYIELTYEESLFFARISKDSIKAKAANLVVNDLFKRCYSKL